MVETYRHSGRSGALGVPIAAAIGTVAAVALGFVYSYSVNWIPIIYVNFIATAAYGFAIGLAVGIGSTLGKIRNSFITLLLGAVTGFIGLYVSWAVDPLARFGDDGAMLFDSSALLAYIKLFYENGFWGLGKGDNTVSGIMLGIVWLAEAGLIVGISAVAARGVAADTPFCEDCNCWTDSEDGVVCLRPPGDDDVARLVDGDLSALDSFERAPDRIPPHIRLDIARCSNCDESNYLTINAVTETVDKDGDKSTSVDALIKNMVIAADDIPRVRDAGHEPAVEDADPAPESDPDTAGDDDAGE